MSWLLDGISYEEERTSTLYSITNENSFLLYYVKNWQGRLYCAENDLENIKSYYRNLAHYNTQDIHIEYTLYSDGEPSYERIKKTIILKPEVFEHLSELYHSQENHEPMRIPEKYNEILLAEKLGTSTSGLSTRDLYAYSTDDMAYQRIHLSMIDNQVYATGKLVISGSEIIDFAGSPLPAELNQYIIDVVFTE